MNESETPSNNDLLADYKTALVATRRAEGTIKLRVSDIGRLARALDAPLLTASPKQLSAYAGREGLCDNYRKKLTESIVMFYRWAHSTALIDTDPAVGLTRVAVPHTPPLPAAPEDIVLEGFAAGSLHERAAIALLATMGLRRTEAATLHPSSRIGRIIRVTGKGQRVRELTLDDVTYALLIQLETEQGIHSYYFPGRFGGHIHPSTLYKWVKHRLSGWTPHSCRRRAGVRGWARTKNLLALQQFYGHTDVGTTQQYVPIHADEIAEIAEAASLTIAPDSRRISGTPKADTGSRADFLERLSNFVAEAGEYGFEIRLR